MATRTRPAVAGLVFQVYSRPVHPELFEVLGERLIEHPDFRLAVRLTPTGHVISWENGAVHLTEATISITQEMPPSRCLLSRAFGPESSVRADCGRGVSYQATYHAEALPAALFASVHDEILADGGKRGMLFDFGAPSRLALAPLAHVTAEYRPGCLFLTAFHTFPRECTILKTQSLIEQRR
jgi:hypothetical protein